MYILSHLTLSYIYGGASIFNGSGVGPGGLAAARAFAAWIANAPHPPSPVISFSHPSVNAIINWGGARQETRQITLNAAAGNPVTIDIRSLGSGVSLHRTRGGETTIHWSTVELRGGDTFHFRAPLDITHGTRTITNIRGAQTNHWRAIAFNEASASTQSMASGSWDGDPVVPISLSVTWEDAIRGHIRGQKVGAYDEGLAGAVIGLFRPGETIFTEASALRTVTTGANGAFEFRNVELYGVGGVRGWFGIRELAAPPGYLLNETLFNVRITAHDQTVYIRNTETGETGLIRNAPMLGRIDGIKVCSTTDEPLAGATFGLFRADETTFTEETTLMTSISGEDGIFGFEDVRLGMYLVRELAAPEGYLLSAEAFEVEIGYHEQIVDIRVENVMILGRIDGIKVCSTTGRPLAGATFGLFAPDETTFTDGTALMTDTSGTDGIFGFEGIPFGRYRVRELAAPEGYLLSDETFEVTIGYDGQIVNIRAENEREPDAPNIPRTGDDTRLPWAWFIGSLLAFGIATVGMIVYGRKKRKTN